MTQRKKSKLEWKREQRTRWLMEGFKAARRQAASTLEALAENLDDRPELARIARVKPRESVRRLRQAAQLVGRMPRPLGICTDEDLEEAPDEALASTPEEVA